MMGHPSNDNAMRSETGNKQDKTGLDGVSDWWPTIYGGFTGASPLDPNVTPAKSGSRGRRRANRRLLPNDNAMRSETGDRQDKTGLAEVSDKSALHFCLTRYDASMSTASLFVSGHSTKK